MENDEHSNRRRVNWSLREFDGKLDPIEVASCDLICNDGEVRPGLGLYHKSHLLLIGRRWVAPDSVNIAHLGETWPTLAALVSVADYPRVDDLNFGEVALTMGMLAALTGIARRGTLLNRITHLEASGYLHHWESSDRLTPSLIRIYPKNVMTGLPIMQVKDYWRPDAVCGVRRRDLIRTVTSRGRNFWITDGAVPAPDPVLKAKVIAAPIVIVDPPEIPLRPEPKNDPFYEKVQFLEFVRAEYDALPQELAAMVGNEKMELSHEVIRSIFQDDLEIRATLRPTVSESGQSGPNQEPVRRGLHQHQDIQESDVNSLVVDTMSPNGGLMVSTACAPSAPPAAAPPAASGLFVAPLSARLRQPGRWSAVESARGGRLTPEAMRALGGAALACIQTYERLLGMPFCVQDVPALEAALASGRTLRFVRRKIEECAAESKYAYRATKEGMASITRVIIPAWDKIKVHNKAKKLGIKDPRGKIVPRARASR